jgi:oligopeptide transport system permease protein
MAVVQNKAALPPAPVRLSVRPKGESLWRDAWGRLVRNKAAMLGLVIIVLTILIALFAPVIAPRTFDRQTLTQTNVAPQWVIDLFPQMKAIGEPGGYVQPTEEYRLGTDDLGRDLLSRIIYGTRVSLAVAFVGPVVSVLVGVSVGLISGYFGGLTDTILMRMVDLMYAFPSLLLIILFMTFFRNSFSHPEPGSFQYVLGQADAATGGILFIFIGIGLTSWMQTARLVRGQVLSVREKEYVEAARSLGIGTRQMLLRHILPNILGPLIVVETLSIPQYISDEAFLSFIGLGVNAPTPSWGSMISEGAHAIGSYPYQVLFPAFALFMVMFAFNFLGDGLRDALDPRMRGVD